MFTRLFCILGAVALLSSACGKSDDKKGGSGDKAGQTTTTSTPPAEDPVMAKAKQLFTMRCVQCHGASGKGDGPLAASLTPKPRNYTSKKWQKTVTDDKIKETIKKGGAAMGLSSVMPAQQDLNDEQLNGLVKLIRSFAK